MSVSVFFKKNVYKVSVYLEQDWFYVYVLSKSTAKKIGARHHSAFIAKTALYECLGTYRLSPRMGSKLIQLGKYYKSHKR